MAAIVRSNFIAVILLLVVAQQGSADDVKLYREGFKQFQAGDYVSAGRSLSQLAPFTQEFGEHARYLLARVHDLSGERPEAIALYEAVIEYDMRCRGAAADALARPQTLKDRPEEKARLERLLGEPAPQYVVRSRFYSGRLMVEEGRFEEAVARLGKAVPDADGVLGDETRLWLGVAQVETKRFDEAIHNLGGLHEAEALRWLARAQVGLGVTPVQRRQNGAGILPSQQERKTSFESAIEVLKKAVELQSSLRDSRGPDADEIRTMIELADLLRRAEHLDAAAEMYAEAAKGGGDSQLAETAKYRWAVALQLAGKYAEADAALEQFTAAFPKSVLLADAAVRHAEDALLARHFEEAMKRFAAVGERYAKTDQAYLATLGVAEAQYQMGHFDEAVKIASQIPEGDRLGDLSAANYLIADCLLRKAPQEAGDDALATARLMQDLSDISDRFKSFVLAHDGDPRIVDASLKMGYCQQRIASLMAEPMERRKPLAAARRMYIGLLRQFPDHPLYPIIVLESARCTSQFGSRMAENELARFQYEPLKNSALAPVALVRLGQFMRNTRRTDAAVKMLTQGRADHESLLMNDPARIAWAAALRFELGMALKESGKYAEAREILQSVLRDFPTNPRAGEIPWRIAQCQREAVMELLLPNRKLFGRRETAEQANITLAAGLERMREVAKVMAAEAKAKSAEPELAAQIAYEAGGCWRTVADFEAESARMAAQEEAQKLKQRGRQRALAPATKPAATQPVAPPGHDSQKEARACFQTVLEIAPDSPTAAEARIALAELDQAAPLRPLQVGRKRASAVYVPTRTELPPVLNLDGSADFPRLEPFLRTASADLMDAETATLDDGLISRTFSLPEEAIAFPGRQN
jgi:tetratricopeptide (TPR) repeat protein